MDKDSFYSKTDSPLVHKVSLNVMDIVYIQEFGITAMHVKLRATGGNKTKTPVPTVQFVLLEMDYTTPRQDPLNKEIDSLSQHNSTSLGAISSTHTRLDGLTLFCIMSLANDNSLDARCLAGKIEFDLLDQTDLRQRE